MLSVHSLWSLCRHACLTVGPRTPHAHMLLAGPCTLSNASVGNDDGGAMLPKTWRASFDQPSSQLAPNICARCAISSRDPTPGPQESK